MTISAPDTAGTTVRRTGDTFTLTLRCPQRPGMVRAVSAFVFERGCDIAEHQQFDDAVRGTLFLRTAFRAAHETDVARLSAAFAPVAAEFAMDFDLTDDRLPRVLVMASRLGHCRGDLIFRWRAGSLGGELVAVVSNHEDLRPMAGGLCRPRHGRAINIDHSFLPGVHGRSTAG